MIQRVLVHFPYPMLMCFGLLLFVGVYLGVLIWTSTSDAQFWDDHYGKLPLRDSTGSIQGDNQT
jgi:hypothetical protein